MQITRLREHAGVSQKELAERLDTTQQQISRLESPSYEGHLLSMLRRVAAAFHARVRVVIEPLPKADKSAVVREVYVASLVNLRVRGDELMELIDSKPPVLGLRPCLRMSMSHRPGWASFALLVLTLRATPADDVLSLLLQSARAWRPRLARSTRKRTLRAPACLMRR
ncbi:MAG: helix-turn-helix domain-containing protein [Chthoniobacterales bacterium]